MSICSLVVFTKPEATEAVKAEIERHEGCEVPGYEAGKLVVLMDHPSRDVMSQTIMEIHNLTGVITVSLVYEYFEDNDTAARASGEERKEAARIDTDSTPAAGPA